MKVKVCLGRLELFIRVLHDNKRVIVNEILVGAVWSEASFLLNYATLVTRDLLCKPWVAAPYLYYQYDKITIYFLFLFTDIKKNNPVIINQINNCKYINPLFL